VCGFYRQSEEMVDLRLITKDLTRDSQVESKVEWCVHPRSPVSYTRAMSFGGGNSLVCGGCLGKCPLPEPPVFPARG
jgi:hypothetical protein